MARLIISLLYSFIKQTISFFYKGEAQLNNKVFFEYIFFIISSLFYLSYFLINLNKSYLTTIF